ncbi:endonuclease [Candidatus Peregrinibacteria bacterium CG11_big_fil_rev_8_21_14_0_20_46_8]|nr:MAG: endonuclease [Candidatus Peregrinibacteria bacterium CG11_big_fil_rev_8_21_14_0_20_46_8]
MYYAYILQSKKDQKLYFGHTNNVEKRLARHNDGQVKSTRSRRPFALICSRSFSSRSEAMKLERYLKILKGGEELKKILKLWGVAKR